MKSPVLLAVCALVVLVMAGWLAELALYADWAPMVDRVLMGAIAAAAGWLGRQMAMAAAEELQCETK